MGEVYRARDTRLDRDVAIKIVPELFATDVDRLIRFEREAKALASLNHPNIAQIHGIEGTALVRALVMEFVDGEDLSQRLTRGAIPVPEALAIAHQIAAALEAAHERGVVHRDLKPANIKVREDGTVKVLDFGLSKALGSADAGRYASDGRSARQDSPILNSPATQLGVIFGTAAYMAPEQAKGQSVDKHADIWTFGVVLYEMLTGRSPFPGDTIADVLAHIVARDPDWSLLPPDTPHAVRQLLKQCLQRDPRRRLRAIGGARFDAAEPAPVRRFGLSGISLATDPWQAITLSPDGRHLAYRGFGTDRIDRLFVRALDAIEPRPIAGSDGGRLPFFSPDGTQLAFFSAGYLRRTTLGTGSPQPVMPLRGLPLGGTWMDDGSIVFVDSVLGLLRVPRGGTAAETVRSADKRDVITPWGLPGSRGVLLAVRVGSESHVGVLSLADGSVRILAQDGWSPAWSPSTGVLFHQGDSIVRLPFDVVTLAAIGPSEAVVAGVRGRTDVQARLFGIAADGTLAYVPATTSALSHDEIVIVLSLF
jgi:eukaryotic-like serine/threonine-protein kinase